MFAFVFQKAGLANFSGVFVDAFSSLNDSARSMSFSTSDSSTSAQVAARNTVLHNAIPNNVVLDNQDLINQLLFCSQTRFTGQLTVNLPVAETFHWDLYFHRGTLVAGISPVHPIRRWRRQFSRYCPNLDAALVDSRFDQRQPWDYPTLMQLVRECKLSLQQLTAIMEGSIIEILFDLIQARHQHCHNSQLQLTQRVLLQHRFNLGLNSAFIGVQPTRVLQQANQAWKDWCEAGLENYSANCAPMIWDAEELRRQTSFAVYGNLMALLDGDRTLRDLAVKCKQDVVDLTQSIMPYIHQDIIGLVEVKDWVYWRPPNGAPNYRSTSPNPSVQALQARPSSPLAVYVEDSRFDCLAMSQILDRAGCRFVNIRDPLQALPILFEHKPDLIFLDLHMPVMNGYEICGHIRRVSAFKETPVIIVTSSDGLVDRVRAKLIGATDFIAKPIEAQKVLTTLQQHLAIF